MVAFPEVDARYADANSLGELGSRQPLLVSSVPEIASERRFSSQGPSLQSHEFGHYIKMAARLCKSKFVDLPIFHKLAASRAPAVISSHNQRSTALRSGSRSVSRIVKLR